MSSVFRNYAQRDNRVEAITLTGNITNNGTKSGLNETQNAAYAAIDLTKARSFTIDARILRLRSDTNTNQYLLRTYISSTKPPMYYPNFEFSILLTPPPNGPSNNQYIVIEVCKTNDLAQNGDSIYQISNQYYSGEVSGIALTTNISEDPQVMTFMVFNNTFIMKSLSYGLLAD